MSTHGGNIEGKVRVNGSVGIISAGGKILQDVTAEWINTVQAANDILGKITTSAGAIAVKSLGSILGNITTVGGATVSAVGDIRSDVTATLGAIVQSAGKGINGKAEAYGSVTQRSGGIVSGSVDSQSFVAIQAVGTNSYTVKALKAVDCLALTTLTVFIPNPLISVPLATAGLTATAFFALGGDVELVGSSFTDVAVTAFGDVYIFGISGEQIDANIMQANDATVITRGGYFGTIKAKDSVEILAKGNVRTEVTCDNGPISVGGKSIVGRFTASPDVNVGNVQLTSWGQANIGQTGNNQVSEGNITATVNGGGNVAIQSAGEVRGTIKVGGLVSIGAIRNISATIDGGKTATAGSHIISSWGAISGDITLKGDTDITAFGDIRSENISIQRKGTSGIASAAEITSWGQVTKNISVEGSLVLQVYGGLAEGAAVKANGAVDFRSLSDSKGTIEVIKPNIAFGRPAGESNLPLPKDLVLIANVVGSFDGTITAADGIGLFAMGNVTGSLTSNNGDVQVKVQASPPTGDATAPTANGFSAIVSAKGDVVLTVAGAVTSARSAVSSSGESSPDAAIKGGTVRIMAGDSISATIESTAGDVTVSAIGSFSSRTVKSFGAANVNATGDISGDVQATNDIAMTSGGVVSATANSTAGTLNVTALGNITGTDQGELKGATGVTLGSFGSILSANVDSGSGLASLFAAQSIGNSTVRGESIDTSAFGLVSGSKFTSTGGNVSVSSDAMISSVTVRAAQSATVTGYHDVSGSVNATFGNSSVTSLAGDVMASVGAGQDVFVYADGAVTTEDSETDSAGRDITINAGGVITAKVMAGQDATLFAVGEIGPRKVQANRNISVRSLGEVSADVTATAGTATVEAGNAVSGTVTGQLDVSVMSDLAGISGDVTSNAGSATVGGLGIISGKVLAAVNATVWGSAITETVTAITGKAISVAETGDISGNVTAGGDLDAFAAGSITSDLLAGGAVTAEALGHIGGNVTAGTSLFVDAEMITGQLRSVGDIMARSVAGHTGGVHASTGNITIETGGGLTSNVTASQGSVYVFAADSSTVTINAGTDVAFNGGGTTVALLTAGRDVRFWSAGVCGGMINSGRHASIVSLDASSLGVTAGGDVVLFAGGSYQGIIQGWSADVSTLGTISGSVSATTAASVYAMESASGLSVSGQDASLTTWGTATNVLVTGSNSADVWTYGDFNGQVSSSGGSVSLTSIGNAHVVIITAATDAVVITGGDFQGWITAGDFGGAITLNGFSGSLDAGGDAILMSGAALDVTATSGRDMLLIANGNLTGTYAAGRDVIAAAYGSIDASISAARDIVQVWSVGGIEGSLTAGRGIGNPYTYAIYTYGDINAVISAPAVPVPPDPNGGSTPTEPGAAPGMIYSIVAWGSVDGTITAGAGVGLVLSGAEVTAAFPGTTVGTIMENDAVLTSGEIPAVPDSGRADVLSLMAQQYALVQADRVQFLQDRAAVRADLVQWTADGVTSLALARATQAQAVSNAATQAIHNSLTDSDTAKGEFSAAKNAATTQRSIAETDIAAQKASLEQTIEAAKVSNKQAQAASAVETQLALTAKIDQQRKIIDQREKQQLEAYKTASNVENQEARLLDQLLTSLSSINVGQVLRDLPANIVNGGIDTVNHVAETHQLLSKNATAAGTTGLLYYYETIGGTLAKIVQLSNVVGAIDGKDPYTMQKWSKWDQLFNGVTGLAGFVNSGFVISAVAARITNGCSLFMGHSCFVGESLVATNWKPAPPLVASADTSTSDMSDLAWILAGCGVVVVVTTIARQRREDGEHAMLPARRQRTSQPERDWDGHGAEPVLLNAEQVDQVFARLDFDPDGVEPHPVPTLAAAAFAAETVTLRESPNCPGIAMRPATPPLPSSTHRPRRAWSAVTVGGVLLAACCFWQGLPAISSLWREEARADVAVEAPQRELVHTQIKDLRPCQRVIANNPQLARQDVPERKIDPTTDRLVSFKLTHPDGSFIEWERVESLPELLIGVLATDATEFDKLPRDATNDATGAAFVQSLIGRTLDVELSEFGVSGPATIVGIATCPEPEAYDGPDRRLITAVFRHTSKNIVDVMLDDNTPSIGCTGNHPYWSVDRQDFLRADQLRRGETLQRADGSHCHIASVTRRDLTEPVTVYNLEIDGHHVYCVGQGGVLVHNSCTGVHSRALANDMGLGNRPSGGYQAAHIVPTSSFWKRPKAVRDAIETAQDKFDEYLGKELRDTEINGFWGQPGHAGTHSNEYFLDLGRAFQDVDSPESAKAALDFMWNKIKSGAYQ